MTLREELDALSGDALDERLGYAWLGGDLIPADEVQELREENERLKNAINPEAANTPADRWDEFAAMVDRARESEAYKDESRKLKALDDAMTVQLPDHRDDLDPQVRLLTRYVEVLREAISENDDCERMATAVAIAQENVAIQLANLRELAEMGVCPRCHHDKPEPLPNPVDDGYDPCDHPYHTKRKEAGL